VNAWDQVYSALKSETYYISDLATMGAAGIKVIRVSSTPNVAADIVTYIGTNAASPNASYKGKAEAVLNEAYKNGVGVMLGVVWDEAQLLTALGGTQSDLANSASTVRVWLRNWASYLAKTFYNHPGLAGWFIANEFVNYAWGNRFISATSDPSLNHIKAMVDVTNDICAEIRAYDGTRVIMSAGGSLGNSSMGTFKGFAEKYVASAGNCDAVSYHWYGDSLTNSSLSHAFVGIDLGGSEILINSLRAACQAAGKALILDECAADYDSPPATVALKHYQKFKESGADLLLDWGWYTNNNSAPDLKTQRIGCLPYIARYNEELKGLGQSNPVSSVCADPAPSTWRYVRTSTSTNGWVRVGASSSYQPSVGSTFGIMFRFREPDLTMVTGRRVLACNDASGGFLITAIDTESSGVADYLQFQIMFAGTLRGLSFQQNKRRPGEWNHYAFSWDGKSTGTSLVNSWFNGVPAVGNTLTNPGTPGVSANPLYLGAAADGLSGNLCDIADLVIVKRTGTDILQSQEVMDYYQRGTLPAGTVLHLPLAGNIKQAVGNFTVTAGANATFP
jgi:hypothetical protein